MTSFIECDHSLCPARATSYFNRGSLSLAFCGHHSRSMDNNLREQGWSQVLIPEETPGGSK